MRINWKIRSKNKTWIITMAGVIVAFVYQVLNLLGIVPKVTESQIMDLITALLTVLAALGIIVDPTTKGINDSDLAMTYADNAYDALPADSIDNAPDLSDEVADNYDDPDEFEEDEEV